jgi:transposase
VLRYARKLRAATPPEARAIIETPPGEECQVDYGTGPMVRDPVTGKYRRTRLFVLTLGYSRKSVRLLVFRSSSRAWAELHERAFRRLGGTTRIVVLDNLREGVLAPDIYDPQLNPLYRDVLAHYGVISEPTTCFRDFLLLLGTIASPRTVGASGQVKTRGSNLRGSRARY